MIGKEGREAYNSLIERKSILDVTTGACHLLRSMDAAKTLPRRSTHKKNDFVLNNKKLQHIQKQQQQQQQQQISQTSKSSMCGERGGDFMLPPMQNAPRPTTLPTRGAAIRAARQAELNVMMMVTSGKSNSNIDMNKTLNTTTKEKENSSPCESPSYVTHTATYKFPSNVNAAADSNPLPVPPKEGKKHIQINAKRHVRKYPLIIPANGVQRTLNKIMASETIPAIQNDRNCYTLPHNGTKSMSSNARHKTPMDLEGAYQNLKTVTNAAGAAGSGGTDDSASLQFESILEADINKGHVLHTPDVTDGFYNFSIQKEHYQKSKELDYDHNKLSGLYVNEDELRNLDIECNLEKIKTAPMTSNKTEMSGTLLKRSYLNKPNESEMNIKSEKIEEKEFKENYIKKDNNEPSIITTTKQIEIKTDEKSHEKWKLNNKLTEPAVEGNELAGHALFQKAKETVEKTSVKKETQPTVDLTETELFQSACRRLGASNSVSCEDLLEFANKKPKGRERGVDSDEVRIMLKVLGQEVIAERCLDSLEFVDWDIHKAIKIIKLQNILNKQRLTMSACVEYLEKCDWDLQTTAIYLKTLN